MAGHVRELSHVMERVTLPHVSEEVEAAILTHFGLPLMAPAASGAGTVPSPEPASPSPESAEVAQIRQAPVQTGGAVIGKDVALPLLQAIAGLPAATLQQGLAHLQAVEFLYET